MKKSIALLLALMLIFSLAACGGADEPEPVDEPDPAEDPAPVEEPTGEVEFVEMTFGDITVAVPSVFDEVQEQSGAYYSAGPDSSVSATAAMSIDLPPEEWNEEVAAAAIEGYFSSIYSDMELASFNGNVEMNGSPVVYIAFYGVNASGVDRFLHVVFVYDLANETQYMVSLNHSADSEFFTKEVDSTIVNSITLG